MSAAPRPLRSRVDVYSWVTARARRVGRHYVVILLLASAVTAAAVWTATSLRFNSDLADLLPPDNPDLRALRRTSDRFLRYYHLQKPSRSLTLAEHGTRFPGVLRDRTWPTLRHLPDGFSLEPYIDARGHLAFPIAKGRVSFVRKVDGHGCIEFNGAEYFIRRKLERQYVVATLSTHHRRVFIKYEGKLIKSVPFPFTGPVIDPLR